MTVPEPCGPGPDDRYCAVYWEVAAECGRLHADIADYEALLARWPRCPAGCNCRVGVEDDPDRNECACDGPCNDRTLPDPENPVTGRTPGAARVPVPATLADAWRQLCDFHDQRDDYAARLKALDLDWARLAAERDQLRERLAAAEAVCVMFGWTGARTGTDREKALHELWRHWAGVSGVSLLPKDHPELSDQVIGELARQRDETRAKVLARIFGSPDFEA